MVRLLPIEELMARGYGSRSTIYRRVKEGKLPRPVKNGALSLWVEGELENFVSSLIAERDAA